MGEQALLVSVPSQIKRGSSGEDNLQVQLNFLHFNTNIQICCAATTAAQWHISSPVHFCSRVLILKSVLARNEKSGCQLSASACQTEFQRRYRCEVRRTQTVKLPLAPTNKQSKGMFTGKSLWTEQQDGGARTTRVWNDRPNKSRHVHERSD